MTIADKFGEVIMLVKFFWIFSILMVTHHEAYANYVYAQEFDHPNVSVLEMQLRENEALLFGQVEEVIPENAEENLKGFQYFKVKLRVDSLWSKKTLKLKPFYTFKFGKMVDLSTTMMTTPVKKNEKLMVVLDSYNPNEVKTLKDHLLSVYEHHAEQVDGKEFFVSKMTKNYSQKNLEFSEIKRLAYLEKMRLFSLEGNSTPKIKDSVLMRSIASENNSGKFKYANDDADIFAIETSQGNSHKIKRRPNSSISNEEEEFSVLSLLLVLVFLAVFSHFVIRYYESTDEEI